MVTDVTTDFGRKPETALVHACMDVPIASPDDLVVTTLNRMRGRSFDSAAGIAVLDADRFVGLATIEQMFAADDGATLRDIMDREPPVVSPDTDQEYAALQAVRGNEPALAVVDDEGRFVGLIPPQRLLAVLLHEHDEDMARLGGYLHSVETTRTTTVESVTRRLWHRLPWLVVGLTGAMASAVLMAAFEDQLNAVLAVAFFVPGIVYLADAVGTQSETVAIRGLSVGIGIHRILAAEAMTGLIVGVLLGMVILPAVALMTNDWRLAVAVAVAVLAASTIATVVALILPWLFQALDKDPAFGSGPLATVLQDLLSILIYLGAVSVLLT